MPLQRIFMLIGSQLVAFCLAFSSKLHCVLQHFTLRLAAKRIAFSTKTHSILHQNALHLAANSPKMGANGGRLK